MSAQPKFRQSITSDFTEEMMEHPSFLSEAMTECCDFPALARYLKTGDALCIRDVIETACEKYANFLVASPDYDETTSELMARLRKAYR